MANATIDDLFSMILLMRLHDTMLNQVVDLDLREPGKVSIYACGPTVYDVPHLGHARTALTYDILKRYLEWQGYETKLVSNITDIDDKIINRSADEGISESDLAATYTAVYVKQLREFGVKDPDARPHATEYVDQMVQIIEQLVANDAAYEIPGSGIYFDVSEFETYGALVQRTAGDLRESAQARISADEEKHDPLDFALWKTAKPGEPTWESPWGPGRPGWHIECVAMSLDLLGDNFDIHGGGSDLTFPHHENERAESEAAGHAFARHWMHSGMLNVSGEKMSKSLGNFQTLGDAMSRYGARPLRLAMLQAHYRSLMELSDETMEGATGGIDRIDAFFRRMQGSRIASGDTNKETKEKFSQTMDNDLGTPDALAIIFEAISAGNSAIDNKDEISASTSLATVTELLDVLGLSQIKAGSNAEIDALLSDREKAREDKNFAEADRIRDELQLKGIEIEDTPNGPIWRYL
ncbi:MAG: cysteine--tRNA ligase [Acidimicrobiales bacterium]|nr:cysteine--tRNA ligase [Acidimicrobiales bacterium]